MSQEISTVDRFVLDAVGELDGVSVDRDGEFVVCTSTVPEGGVVSDLQVMDLAREHGLRYHHGEPDFERGVYVTLLYDPERGVPEGESP